MLRRGSDSTEVTLGTYNKFTGKRPYPAESSGSYLDQISSKDLSSQSKTPRVLHSLYSPTRASHFPDIMWQLGFVNCIPKSRAWQCARACEEPNKIGRRRQFHGFGAEVYTVL